MNRAANDNPHPELELWLKLALNRNWWPTDDRPYIKEDVLLIPQAYFTNWDCRELKSLEWSAVRSREDLLEALGLDPD